MSNTDPSQVKRAIRRVPSRCSLADRSPARPPAPTTRPAAPEAPSLGMSSSSIYAVSIACAGLGVTAAMIVVPLLFARVSNIADGSSETANSHLAQHARTDDTGLEQGGSRPGPTEETPSRERPPDPPPAPPRSQASPPPEPPQKTPKPIEESPQARDNGNQPEPDVRKPKADPRTKEVVKADALRDIRAKRNLLRLPKQGLEGVLNPVELARIYVTSPSDCQLDLIGGDRILRDQARLTLKIDDRIDDGRTWQLLLTKATSPGLAIAEARLTGTSLDFRWRGGAEARGLSGAVSFCLLRVQVGSETETCRLIEPQSVQPLRIRPATGKTYLKLPAIPVMLNPDVLRFDLDFHGVGRSTVSGGNRLAIGDACSVSIQDGSHQIEMTLHLDAPADGLVRVECNASSVADGKSEMLSDRAIKKRIASLRREIKQLSTQRDRLTRTHQVASQQVEQLELLERRVSFPERINVRNAKNRFEAELTRTKQQIGVISTRIETLMQREKRHIALNDTLKRIQKKGRLLFRAYVDVNGEEVCVYETTRIVSTPPAIEASRRRRTRTH